LDILVLLSGAAFIKTFRGYVLHHSLNFITKIPGQAAGMNEPRLETSQNSQLTMG
jgi:hypothetical protein